MEQFLKDFEEAANAIALKYKNPSIPSGGGITPREMLNRFENVQSTIPIVDQELQDHANSLLKKYGLQLTEDLGEKIKEIGMNCMRSIVKGNTTG